MKLIVPIFFAIAVVAQTSSPTPSPTPVRDPQAIAVVEHALVALGGHEVHKQFRTAVIRGTMQMSGSQETASFVWEDDVSGQIPEFRKEIRSGSSVRTFVSDHGTPAHIHDGKLRQLPRQTGWSSPPFYLPGVVLTRELLNHSYSIQLVPGSGDGAPIHVRISWELNQVTSSLGAQDWFFDPVTSLPARVQYMLPGTEKQMRLASATVEFSDFRSMSGITLPMHLTAYGVDGKARSFTVTDVQLNAALNASHFEPQGEQQ